MLKPRFTILTLMLVVAVLATALVVAPRIHQRLTSRPLTESVNDFNSHGMDAGTPLTENEVVEAIENLLPKLDASDQVQQIYARIARTHRLPKDALFRAERGKIALDVSTGPKFGYAFPIRGYDLSAFKSPSSK